MSDDQFQMFGSLIRVYELIETLRADIHAAGRSAEQTWDALEALRNEERKALAMFAAWPLRFQAIAERREGGVKLDSRILRSMRGTICEDHPEMTVSDVNDLPLATAYGLLAEMEPGMIGGDGGDEKWVTRAKAATISGANRGTITKAVQGNKLATNGKDGRNLRIDRASLTVWMERRALRPESIESDASVLAKFKKFK